jgi:flagellar motor switch protein FliN/FliY
MNYMEAWIATAGALLSQALAGGPSLEPCPLRPTEGEAQAFEATVAGDAEGRFTVILDPALMTAALLGEDADQKAAWGELLKEAAEAAAGELLARTGSKCRVERFGQATEIPPATRSFQLKSGAREWQIQVCDDVRAKVADRQPPKARQARPVADHAGDGTPTAQGLELLLDVELDATIRFGCRELPLKDILELGPGDVVTLDRHINDPADLIVGDKIVARGEVVLVNGNFGLKITEVAAPRKRLESIRCLF